MRAASEPQALVHRARARAGAILSAVLPVVGGLAGGGLVILLLGSDPLAFAAKVVQYGLLGENWMRSLTLAAPLLLIAVGLLVAFRGRLWNLGYAGQYLLGAVMVSGFAPGLFELVPTWFAVPALLIGSALLGALLTVVPAILKALYGTNEIITSLVMSFIAIGVVGLLIKGPLRDQTQPIPQTRVIDTAQLLPYIAGTKVHIGLLAALGVAVIAHLVLRRSAVGLRIDVFGASNRAASHAGINPTLMTVGVFLVSGALIGFAGGLDIIGHESYQRANWNPDYGTAILPFVFLARLSPLLVIPFVLFYTVLATGGILAAQQVGLSSDILLVVVGLILLFMIIAEYAAKRSGFGKGYLPAELAGTVAQLNPLAGGEVR